MPMTVADTREPALAPSPPPDFSAAEIGRLAHVCLFGALSGSSPLSPWQEVANIMV